MDIFRTVTRVHLVGIKGVAMASLAQCLDDLGIRVTGSDLAEDFVTRDVLHQRDFNIVVGFDPTHVPDDCELVVYTGAHQGKNNPEVQSAIKRGIPVMSHAEALGELMIGKKAISVCGTGGKSTTSAMLAWILDFAGARPSFSVGVGKVNNFGVSGRYTQIHSESTDEISRSGWFVAEADEYAVDPTSDHRPRFCYQHPVAIVATNLSYDHPDIYPTFDSLKKTFAEFFTTVDDCVYVNADSKDLLEIFTQLRDTEKIHYESCSVGFVDTADYKLTLLPTHPGKTKFSIEYRGYSERQPHLFGKHAWEGELAIPGMHNIRNAGLAMVTAYNELGIDFDTSLKALAEFTGTMRRFDDRGKYVMMQCYDDYAHTPDEIRATLTALREWQPHKKIIAVFQPHTYSRTKALFDGFVEALALADEVILLDIFASARESADPSISSQLIVERLQATGDRQQKTIRLIPTIDELVTYLPTKAHDEGNVLITMGAGDIYKVYERIQLTANS